MTDEQKAIYALGLSMYRSIGQFDLSPAEVAIVEHAFSDAAAGKPALDLNEWGPKIQPLAQARAVRVSEREKANSSAYLAKAAGEPGAVKTPSGLIYREIRPGTGASPKATDTVKVNYRGTLVDGSEWRHPLLDGGRSADEGRRKGRAGVSVRSCLRRSRPARHTGRGGVDF
jgi:FKBP-type peptidyl-prolyl cis-trans isomerase FkpA